MPIDFFKEQQNFFTRALLILLAVTFVVGFGYVGGISIGGRGPSGGTAVEINGEKVPLAQFYNLRDALYRQYQQQIPNLPDDAIDFVTARTLDNIVELKLLSQKARELGLRISDEELAESIVNNPAFQIDGQFVGAERYADFITNRLNQSVGEFEKGYKDELLARKLVALINESAKVTDEELLNLYKTQNEEVNLNYVSFSPQDYLASIFPTDEEIQKYYDNNKADFLSEEERKAKYLRVTTSDFEKNVQVSDEELKAYYNSYKDEFKIGDELRTFEVVKDEIKSKLKDAKTTAYYNEFLYNLESGKKIKSIEKFSAENSLGEVKQSFYFKSGEASTDIPFEVKSKAFTSDAGEVTYLQMTDAIWLFEVVDIKDRQQLELASIREDIVGILKNNNARDKARIVADETLNKFISSNQSFKENAESQNLVVNETGFFNRIKGPQAINDDLLIFDAFQLKNENETASKIYSSGDSFFIVSLKEKKPLDMDDFERNKILVKQQEIARQQNEIISNWVERIRSEAKILPNQSLFQSQG